MLVRSSDLCIVITFVQFYTCMSFGVLFVMTKFQGQIIKVNLGAVVF